MSAAIADARLAVHALTGLVEAATRRLRAQTVRLAARQLERGLQRAFQVQGKRFLRHFERRAKKTWPAEIMESIHSGTPFRVGHPRWLRESATDDVTSAMADAARETEKVFTTALTTAARTGLAAGARVLRAELGYRGSFSLKSPAAVAYLAEHGAALVAGINETTRAYLQTVVTEAVDQGWSYSRTAQAISARFREFAVGRPQAHIDSRAHLIAVTEAGEAYMAGQYQTVQQLAGSGLVVEKAWSTIGDDRVSDGCQENEAAGWIAYDAAFPSGDLHPLRFPGCRCDIRYRTVSA